jgi:hypothetical protein
MFDDLAACSILMLLVVVFASMSRVPNLIDALCEHIRAKTAAVANRPDAADEDPDEGSDDAETVRAS